MRGVLKVAAAFAEQPLFPSESGWVVPKGATVDLGPALVTRSSRSGALASQREYVRFQFVVPTLCELRTDTGSTTGSLPFGSGRYYWTVSKNVAVVKEPAPIIYRPAPTVALALPAPISGWFAASIALAGFAGCFLLVGRGDFR